MSRQSLMMPLSIVITGVLLIVMLLADIDANPQAAPLGAYTNQELTQTATALTATAAYFITRTGTPTTTGTAGTTSPTTAGTAGTRTPTRGATSATPSPTATLDGGVVETDTPVVVTPSLAPTPTLAPTATPTLTATDDLLTPTPTDELSCPPGQEILIDGSGPPRAGFLVFFEGRAVGGGSVDLSGHFAVMVVLGDEVPGEHTIVVKVRGTQQVLRRLTCQVPAVTPTPLPTRFPWGG